MALPKLNNANYELTLPSTGKQLRYRPFLVKEQKALMIAQESEDDKLIENTFAQIISDCVLDEIDPYKLPMFDIEFIFLKIRGKSVGEKVQLKLLCPDDNETYVEAEIDLEEVNIMLDEDHNTECTLGKDANGNDCSITMNYPSVEATLRASDETSSVERIFSSLTRNGRYLISFPVEGLSII